MNSRERVLATLRHEEPDRVPIDSGSTSATSISAMAYASVKRHLGIPGPVAVTDVVQQLTTPEQWYLDMFDVDIVDVTRNFALDTTGWLPWELSDGTQALLPPWIQIEQAGTDWVYKNDDGLILGKMPVKGWFFDQTYWPLLDASPDKFADGADTMADTMWAHMRRPLVHLSGTPEYADLMRENARYLYEETDYAIMLNSGVSLFESAQFLRRTDNLLMDLATDAPAIEDLLDRLLEANLASLKNSLDPVKGYVHAVKINDDLGLQTGPMISPQMFRDIFKPRFKAEFEFVKSNYLGVHIFLHSCGAVSEFIPDLIDIGLDILSPVQTTAAGMAPKDLKREYGKDLTFWGGGVDTQDALSFGTPDDVRRDVAEKMRAFAPGGGFIFNQSHNIAPEVPAENILAMFETVKEIREYPIAG